MVGEGTMGTPTNIDLRAGFGVRFYGEVIYGSVGSCRSVRVR